MYGPGALERVQRTWNYLAQRDALWSICTDPSRTGGKWDAESFFATGEAEIEVVLAHLRRLGLEPHGAGRALDFGCGAGRLTRALTTRFDQCIGVDISASMLELAKQHSPRVFFELNETGDLRRYADSSFGFIYSSIVLQHMPPPCMRGYLREFARILEPNGLLVCQIPDYHHRFKPVALLQQQLQLRGRVRSFKRRLLGYSPEPPHMEMHWLDEGQIRKTLARGGCSVVDVQRTNSLQADFNGNLIYLVDPPAFGMISKQYCVLKEPAAAGPGRRP